MCDLPRRSFFLWDVTQTFRRASRDIPGNDCEGECRGVASISKSVPTVTHSLLWFCSFFNRLLTAV